MFIVSSPIRNSFFFLRGGGGRGGWGEVGLLENWLKGCSGRIFLLRQWCNDAKQNILF